MTVLKTTCGRLFVFGLSVCVLVSYSLAAGSFAECPG